MPFEPFKRPRGNTTTAAAIRVGPRGDNISLNKKATDLLEEKDYVKFLFDESARQLALEPTDNGDDYAYKVSYQRGKGTGRALIGAAALIKQYSIATGTYPVKQQGAKWLVADVGYPEKRD